MRSWRASGARLAVVDSGPLYASVDIDDRHHERSVEVLLRPEIRPVIPALVVAEVTYLVGSRLGPRVEAEFLAGLGALPVQAPFPEDWARIAELVHQYGHFPLGGTDASVVALAERLGTAVIITLDRRNFGAVRPRHSAAFRLLPDA